MRTKVARVTQAFLDEGGGNVDLTAKLYANFASQRSVQPFVPRQMVTPQQRFGENALATLSEAKKVNRKAGCAADMLRRSIIVAGSAGPLSPHQVCGLWMLVWERTGVTTLLNIYIKLTLYNYKIRCHCANWLASAVTVATITV